MATTVAPPVAARAALETAARSLSPAARELDVTVAFDLGEAGGWTLRIRDGVAAVTDRIVSRPDTRVSSDPRTLLAIAEARESGVKAFLDGRVAVRGNLALALRLDGLFERPRPARFPRGSMTPAGGLRTFYLEAGDGPPVVLLHGLGATNASFLPTLWDLAKDHRVLAPDLPGFGDSSKPLRAYNSRFYARWLRWFLDEVGVERADVVGNSLGGRVAIEMGLSYPDRVDRLVLLTPSPAFIRRRQLVRLVRLLRPELGGLRVPIPHRAVVRFTKRMFARPERLPDRWYEAAADEFLRVFSSPRGRIAFFSAARQIYLEEPYGESGFWDRLPTLGIPTMFVWGERDWLVPARFERHVQRALPSATSVVLPDCGHVPQFELPDETHGLVREFLS